MIIGRIVHDKIIPIDKLQEKVQLAAGLDTKGYLSQEAQTRALDCLKRFAQRIQGLPKDSVKAVGTNTFRIAKNIAEFIHKAEHILGHPIAIISGREEARLIYLGIVHTLSDNNHKRLVIDIGGGSSEFIIGTQLETFELESLHMGCLSYKRFFPNDTIKPQYLDNAVVAAQREVRLIEQQLKKRGWQQCLGASGTIRTIQHVLATFYGLQDKVINYSAMKKLAKYLTGFNTFQEIDLPGVKSERKSIFVPGFAILLGIFKQLNINQLHYSDGALREGLLYSTVSRFCHEHEAIRDRTIKSLQKTYHVDIIQAKHVCDTALTLFSQVSTLDLTKADLYTDLLKRATQVHEIGLAIAHNQFHKHGAYLIKHSDLAGFSQQEQHLLSLLIRCHRRKIVPALFTDIPLTEQKRMIHLLIILRLSVLLHRARLDQAAPKCTLSLGESDNSTQTIAHIDFQANWLKTNPLTYADLKQEKKYLKAAGITLTFA